MNLKNRCRRALGAEQGWVIVVAVVVMTLMLGLGLALLKIVDTQAQQSGNERINESAFNLAEGLLTAQATVLQHNWPSRAPCAGNLSGCALASGINECTQANSATYPNQCPSATEIASAFSNVDTQGNPVSWKVQVRDDKNCPGVANPIYYKLGGAANCVAQNPGGADCVNSGAVPDSCKYDTNGGTPNRRLWVRIDATVGSKTRSLVALLQLERLSIPFTPTAVTAGAVDFSNAGNKTIVDAGSSNITVRCNATPSTTLFTNLAQNGTAVQVNDANPNNWVVGNKYVIMGANPETVTLASRSVIAGKVALVLNPAAQLPHVAGDPIMLAPGTNNTCEGWLNGVQLTPQYHYVENTGALPGLGLADLGLLESGGATVYQGTCPATTVAAWTGGIIIKDPPAGGCPLKATGNLPINSVAVPGFVIVEGQTAAGPALDIPNNTTYFGVVYLSTAGTPSTFGTDPNEVVLTIGANAQICGGVVVDDHYKVQIGQANNGNSAVFCNGHQTGASIIFDPNAFKAFGAAGAAGLVQNTWRELVKGQ